MKASKLLAFGMAPLATALPTAPSATVFPSTNGTRFTIDNQTAYFAGTNSYWLPFLTSNKDVDSVLDHISTSGLRILRVWGFNDGKSLS
jgi:mannan endo-1,4-beta-mannosidase